MALATSRRPGHFVLAAAGVTLLGGGAAFFVTKNALGRRPAALTTMSVPAAAPDNRAIGAALHAAGIHPYALAAAGATGNNITAMFPALAQAEGDPCTALLQAEVHVGEARASVQRLSRLVASGLATEHDVDALAASQTAYTNALSRRDTYAAAVAATASAQLAPQAQTNLADACDAAPLKLPCAYAPTVSTEADALALRRALAAERTASRWGEETPAGAASLIAAAEVAAADARAAMTANGTAVMAAWHAAIE